VLKISEVYKKQTKVYRERPDGSEYAEFSTRFDTRECLLNPAYVVAVHSHEFTSSVDIDHLAGVFPENTKFSTFVLDGNSFRSSEIIVVGSFDKFCRMLEPPHS